MGFVRKHTGMDLTGGGARRAAEQTARGQEALQREGLASLTEGLAPFKEVGTDAANMLLQSIFNPQDFSPDQVLNDPFYKAQADQQARDVLAQRSALGLAGSGGTSDILNKNLLLLGEQFRGNRMNENQARFNQLFNTAAMGQNAAAQTGTNTLNTLTNIGNVRGMPLAVGAQVASNQGQQFMQALPDFMNGMGFGGGSVGAGGAAGGAGGLGSLGSMLGGGLNSLGGMLGGLFSDRRMKRDIKKISSDEFGNIYRFKYLWSDDEFEGRMADELKEINPDYVEVDEDTGYMKVQPQFMAVRVNV